MLYNVTAVQTDYSSWSSKYLYDYSTDEHNTEIANHCIYVWKFIYSYMRWVQEIKWV